MIKYPKYGNTNKFEYENKKIRTTNKNHDVKYHLVQNKLLWVTKTRVEKPMDENYIAQKLCLLNFIS